MPKKINCLQCNGSGQRFELVYRWIGPKYLCNQQHVRCAYCSGTGGKTEYSSEEIDSQIKETQLIVKLITDAYTYVKTSVTNYFWPEKK